MQATISFQPKDCLHSESKIPYENWHDRAIFYDAVLFDVLRTEVISMKLVIIDYGSGNLHSALKAFELANQNAGLGYDIRLTDKADEVRLADRIVLPGVGAFGDCAQGLQAVEGMTEALENAVIHDGKPFLGICVGMQLLADKGLEHGSHKGLGWIKGVVQEIEPNDPNLKIPHMGWNTLEVCSETPHALLTDIETGGAGQHAYFVHSYHFVTENPAEDLVETDYGGRVTAVVGRDNIVGVQFHPEKSQKMGLKLIENFLRWKP